MKILFLTSRLPFPPDRGDRLRAYHVLRELGAEHEVHLVSFVDHPVEDDSRRRLLSFCARVETVHLPKWNSLLRAGAGMLSSAPLQVRYYRDGKMAGLVSSLGGKGRYDLVYSHLFRIFPYARSARGAYSLLDFTDVVSREVEESSSHRSLLPRILYRMEAKRIRRFEAAAVSRADECWVISSREKELLTDLGAKGNIRIVPNGIDDELIEDAEIPRERGRILFLGHLEVFHNIDAARFFSTKIFPEVKKRAGSDTEFVIGGAGCTSAVRHLESIGGVVVHGFVPDLKRFYGGAALFVAPLRFASGTQNKALQAMACATPSILSPDVAAGIGGTAGRDYLVASTEKEWIDKVSRILEDPDRARTIGEAGRRFVRSTFSWGDVRKRMREIAERIGR